MTPLDFLKSIRFYSIALLDATTGTEREQIAAEIAANAALSACIFMLLAEGIAPVLPPPPIAPVQEVLLQ